MGNYNNIPPRPPINFKPTHHEFESSHIQRIKQTPFTNAQVYSLDPPIFIDPLDIRMSELIQPRVPTQQFFPPSQLLKIMQNVVSGLVDLQQHGYPAHGDLSLQTIYYDKKNKVFKITHPIFSPESGYQLSKKGKRFSYLSPEQLLGLTDPEQLQQNIVSIKSDLFTLGIVMLEVSTLLPSSQIYCPETYIIFDKEIKNRLEVLKQYYQGLPLIHQKFARLISNLLQYDQSKRRTSKQFLWELKQMVGPNKSQPIPPEQVSRMPFAVDAGHGNYIRR